MNLSAVKPNAQNFLPWLVLGVLAYIGSMLFHLGTPLFDAIVAVVVGVFYFVVVMKQAFSLKMALMAAVTLFGVMFALGAISLIPGWNLIWVLVAVVVLVLLA